MLNGRISFLRSPPLNRTSRDLEKCLDRVAARAVYWLTLLFYFIFGFLRGNTLFGDSAVYLKMSRNTQRY